MSKAIIPSPDALLIDAVDRLLAIPQRRGILLPSLLVPLAFVSPIGMFAFAFGLWLIGGNGLAPIWAGIACIEALLATKKSMPRLRDARSWTPQKAQSYRAAALRMREGNRLLRSLDIGMVIVGLVTFVSLLIEPPHPVIVAVAGMFLLWTSGQGLRNYADCAMPHDPDLTQRAPVPSTA